MVSSSFLLPSDDCNSANAVPTMCGGAIVWTVFSRYGVESTDRMGILGIGSLGHLAIKLAAAMGCQLEIEEIRGLRFWCLRVPHPWFYDDTY